MNFKTPAGEAAFMASYDATLEQWPVPYVAMRVPTRFGATHMIGCGPEDGEPLVLLHAFSTSSAVWIRNIAALSQMYRTFLVDINGDANKSESSAPFRSRSDCVGWLSDVFDGLKLDQAHLGGMSYGGWMTLNFALAAPSRVKRIVLIAPAASFAKFRLSFFLHFLGPLFFPTRAAVRKSLQWLSAAGHAVDERLADQMFQAARHFRFPKDGIYPTVFTDDELRRLCMPALLLVGDREVIYDAHLAVNRALQLIPGIQAEVIPDASHLLIMEQPEVVNRRLLAFLGSTEPVSGVVANVAALN
jgi:pimeloyl-ACP methyl ester carboxylesterase